MSNMRVGLSWDDLFLKRSFDLVFSFFGLVFVILGIAISFLLATINTGHTGFFIQKRVGRYGNLFGLVKIRTMRSIKGIDTNVTTEYDPRITELGRFFRKSKIDELPQLFNILFGHMSFVGPRPDVPGFADMLQGKDRLILNVRPGITGPATLKYRKEEILLATIPDPETYNRKIIFPDKIRLNCEYIKTYSLRSDIKYILKTIFSR